MLVTGYVLYSPIKSSSQVIHLILYMEGIYVYTLLCILILYTNTVGQTQKTNQSYQCCHHIYLSVQCCSHQSLPTDRHLAMWGLGYQGTQSCPNSFNPHPSTSFHLILNSNECGIAKLTSPLFLSVVCHLSHKATECHALTDAGCFETYC